ncbi:urea transporter [Escherichia coli]|uniref:urea transporter n=1 Tax=Escherichia coli TaxID=562 RepID=UPI001F0FDA8E|nr:urea transporter [Escherichia coli]
MFIINNKNGSVLKIVSLSVQSVFRGYAQVLLQNSILTGMFFFLAVSVTAYEFHRPEVFYYSVIGAILSPVLAWFLGYPREEISQGLWGYNAILYSIAVSAFLPFSIQSQFLLIVGIMGIVLFTPLLSRVLRGFPVLTIPFILATWGVCIVTGRGYSAPSPVENSIFFLIPADYVRSVINNFLEIFLLSGTKGGILVMVGLFFSCRKVFFMSVVISCISTLISCFDSSSTLEHVTEGLYGYNIVLTMVAIYLFSGPRKSISIIFGTLAIVMTFLGNVAFSPLLSYVSLPLLTLPFVISSWLFILAQRFFGNVRDTVTDTSTK